MEINLDQLIQDIEPWDCSIVIAGKSYPLKPLTIADLMKLNKTDLAVETMIDMFEQKPPVETMTIDALGGLGAAIGAVCQQRLGKHRASMQAKAAAMLAPSTAGS